MLFQVSQFGQTDLLSTIIWFVLFIVFIFFGPRLMTVQSIFKLESDTAELEKMAEKSRNYVIKYASKKPSARIASQIRNFLEFFIITPIDTDPYGLMKKLDYVLRNSDNRFTYFADQIAPSMSYNEKKNLKNSLAGAITTYQIAKIVRHNLEIIKKYKMYQLAMILQIQIPLIKRIANASMHATKAFTENIPIGDGIGCIVAAHLIKRKYKTDREDEFVFAKSKVRLRDVWVAKAEGSGASTGYPGKFLLKFLKKNKINRIITVDAGMKLEGEKTGAIAEGVGVAIGGSGVDRYEIEDVAVKQNIPLDAVIIKVSDEDALMPMKREVLNSISYALEAVEAAVMRAKKGEKILIIGVGNTCGIGNDFASIAETEKRLKAHHKKVEEEKKKK